MKLTKTFLFLTFLLISQICFAQEYIQEENWLREVAGEYCAPYQNITYRFENFTQQDISNAKAKLKSIKQFAPINEWEGLYWQNTAIGDNRLIWNSDSGFLNFYCYHDLTRLNYGKAKDSTNFVEFDSEKLLGSNPGKRQRAEVNTKLVKVRVGKRHYLVPENELKDFCEAAVGVSTKNWEDFYYWTKVNDKENEIFGLPILSPEHRRFLRSPIEARIISIENKKFIPNEQSTKEFNFDDIHYSLTLNAGKNKGIKIKMNFFVEDLGEWIEITKVSQTKSIGIIRRDFDENGREQCRDDIGGAGQLIVCKEIKAGMLSKTKMNYL